MDRFAGVTGLAGRFEFDLTRCLAIKRLAQHQVPIRNATAVGGCDLAVLHAQVCNRLVKFGGCQVQQNSAHFCAGILHGGGAIGHRERAGGYAFVRHQSGVARDYLNARHINV